jgi:hypothetical protein
MVAEIKILILRFLTHKNLALATIKTVKKTGKSDNELGVSFP